MLRSNRSVIFFLPILAIMLVLLACGLGSQGGGEAEATLTAMSVSIPQTLTAASIEEAGSDDLATAQAEATARSQDVQASQTSDASSRDVNQLATATVAAPVVAELPRYNIDPNQGHLGWVHDPVTITIEGYHQFNYANDHMQVTARDFVMAADITWDTQYGASGCGFMFRSNGDKNKPNQYMVVATRMGNGHVLFTAVADGELANVRDFFPKTEDTSFQWQNGTTNRLAIVGRGTVIEIYTNGVKVGEVDATQPPPPMVLPKAPTPPPGNADLSILQDYQYKVKEHQDLVKEMQSNYQVALGNFKNKPAIFEDGFVAMLALSESGTSVCKFDKAWLWLIEP
jgi:hypothetical protein